MSNTWHHIQPKLFWRNYFAKRKFCKVCYTVCKVHNEPEPKIPFKYEFNYNKNPSWWNRLFNRRPKRRQDTIACKQIINGKLDAEKAEFSHSNKPNNWYW